MYNRSIELWNKCSAWFSVDVLTRFLDHSSDVFGKHVIIVDLQQTVAAMCFVEWAVYFMLCALCLVLCNDVFVTRDFTFGKHFICFIGVGNASLICMTGLHNIRKLVCSRLKTIANTFFSKDIAPEEWQHFSFPVEHCVSFDSSVDKYLILDGQ